ncbi:MAG: 4'-phosphopantetheinyl transferase superfamily protein [Saprospiraceae bacterium]|nr:MAG: 4'-phosphopantetheinyl transferase superfamily protein [Saprospiraceae bacterium]
MALIEQKRLPHGVELGIWEIAESESYFLSQLRLHEEEKLELANIKGRRRVEWLASRYLVHLMLVDVGEAELAARIPVLKDEFGKPHLHGSGYYLSFSHSHSRVAVILAPVLTGIDIQAFVRKIHVIEHRLLSRKEAATLKDSTRLEHLHLYWGAKESLYKAYGRRDIDFRKNLLVGPFDFRPESGAMSGLITKDDFSRNFELHYEMDGEYFLVWCLEIKPEVES